MVVLDTQPCHDTAMIMGYQTLATWPADCFLDKDKIKKLMSYIPDLATEKNARSVAIVCNKPTFEIVLEVTNNELTKNNPSCGDMVSLRTRKVRVPEFGPVLTWRLATQQRGYP